VIVHIAFASNNRLLFCTTSTRHILVFDLQNYSVLTSFLFPCYIRFVRVNPFDPSHLLLVPMQGLPFYCNWVSGFACELPHEILRFRKRHYPNKSSEMKLFSDANFHSKDPKQAYLVCDTADVIRFRIDCMESAFQQWASLRTCKDPVDARLPAAIKVSTRAFRSVFLEPSTSTPDSVTFYILACNRTPPISGAIELIVAKHTACIMVTTKQGLVILDDETLHLLDRPYTETVENTLLVSGRFGPDDESIFAVPTMSSGHMQGGLYKFQRGSVLSGTLFRRPESDQGVVGVDSHPLLPEVVCITARGKIFLLEATFRSVFPGPMYPHGFEVMTRNAFLPMDPELFDNIDAEGNHLYRKRVARMKRARFGWSAPKEECIGQIDGVNPSNPRLFQVGEDRTPQPFGVEPHFDIKKECEKTAQLSMQTSTPGSSARSAELAALVEKDGRRPFQSDPASLSTLPQLSSEASPKESPHETAVPYLIRCLPVALSYLCAPVDPSAEAALLATDILVNPTSGLALRPPALLGSSSTSAPSIASDAQDAALLPFDPKVKFSALTRTFYDHKLELLQSFQASNGQEFSNSSESIFPAPRLQALATLHQTLFDPSLPPLRALVCRHAPTDPVPALEQEYLRQLTEYGALLGDKFSDYFQKEQEKLHLLMSESKTKLPSKCSQQQVIFKEVELAASQKTDRKAEFDAAVKKFVQFLVEKSLPIPDSSLLLPYLPSQLPGGDISTPHTDGNSSSTTVATRRRARPPVDGVFPNTGSATGSASRRTFQATQK
jgi:hypothetical protein